MCKNKLPISHLGPKQSVVSWVAYLALLDSSPVPDEVAVSGAESDAEVDVVSWVDWSTDA